MLERARLALDLMEKYDRLLPSLKALGAVKRGELTLTPEATEQHRRAVTPWFNHLYNLLHGGLIDAHLFATVASPAHARQWVDHVAGLDAEVRKMRSGERAAPSNPVEAFWISYANGLLRLPGRRRWQVRFAEWLLGRACR